MNLINLVFWWLTYDNFKGREVRNNNFSNQKLLKLLLFQNNLVRS